MPRCAQCGQDSPDGFRFCGACGAPLATAEPARETRKVVTVLFSDVTGSTALGERLDAEHVRRVMARYFAEARQAVERHGGTVEKFIGDAVMAVFGIPEVHEDDALRAVRAACELRDAVARLGDELERERGAQLVTRTGVDTGEVVVGEGETLATGDAVNVAARLEQAAAPGEILIGAETHRLVRDAVESVEVGPLQLKGKSERPTAFRVTAVIPGRAGVSRRLDAPLVGRDRELRLLHEAFEQAVAGRTCQLVTVLGAAGVGKSRLAAELVRALGRDAVALTGRCLAYGDGVTYWPLREMVDDLQSRGLDEAAWRDLEETLASVVRGTGTASPDEIAPVVRRSVERLARERPLVLVVDDLQWAEPRLLDLVEHIADWTREAPIMLVCLARPELLEVRPGWAGGKLDALSTLLRPLGEDAGADLVASLLGQPAAPELTARVLAAAEGNPLFIEELLRMLVEDGRLVRSNGLWQPSGGDSALEVPPTVQALLAARVDRLPVDERAVLGCGAVEGKVFHRGAVAHLADTVDVDAAVGALVRKELVTPAAGQVSRDEAFAFRHQMLRDAAYESLPKAARAELHERFAGWLDAAVDDRPETDEFVGYHLEQAHRYLYELGSPDRAAGAARRAAPRLEAAARRALSRGDVTAARKLLRRALALLPADDPAGMRLLPHLVRALADEGHLDEAAAALAEAHERAEAAGGSEAAISVRLAGCYLAFSTDPDRTREEASWVRDEAIPALEAKRDDAGLASAWYLLVLERWMAADAAGAIAAVERSAEYARHAGDRHAEVQALDWRYVALVYGPQPISEGLRDCDAALAAGAHGLLEAFVRNARSGALAMLGRYDDARAEHARVLALYEELGHRLTAAAVSGHVGAMIELLAGDLPSAEAAARESVRRLEAMGERGYVSNSAAYLARVLVELDRLDEALEAAELAEATSTPGDVSAELEWRVSRARALARLGQAVPAERLAREAVALADASDWLASRGDASVSLGEALAAAGRGAEAEAAFREALVLYERKEVRAAAEGVRARLRALGA